MTEIDTIKEMRSELLKAVREGKSQSWVNNRLGFSSNKVAKWESGEVDVSWPDFVSLCEVCDKNLEKPFYKILGFNQDIQSTSQLIAHLCNKVARAEVIKLLQISDSKFSKMIHGKTDPKLLEILQLVDYHHELSYLLSNIVNNENCPLIRERFLFTQRWLKLFSEYPMAMPILSILISDTYKKSDQHRYGDIAQALQIDESVERDVFEQLSLHQLVKFENNKYHPIHKRILLNTGGVSAEDKSLSLKIKRFWLQKSLDLTLKDDKKHNLGYMIFSCSTEAYDEVNRKVKQCYLEVRKILEKDKASKDKFSVLNMQLLDLSPDFSREQRSMDCQ